MTQRLVEVYHISLERLEEMELGSQRGPYRQGYLVNSRVRRGEVHSGWPEADLVIRRFGEGRVSLEVDGVMPVGLWGIINLLPKGSSVGPKAGGQTAEEVMAELESDAHSLPGEIKNLGE